MRFTVQVTLLQPEADSSNVVEHPVMGRRVSAGGGSRGVVDGALVGGGSETWQVDSPPEGLGTRWRARIADVDYEIGSVVREEEMLPVWTLTLTSTALTGELA